MFQSQFGTRSGTASLSLRAAASRKWRASQRNPTISSASQGADHPAAGRCGGEGGARGFGAEFAGGVGWAVGGGGGGGGGGGRLPGPVGGSGHVARLYVEPAPAAPNRRDGSGER